MNYLILIILLFAGNIYAEIPIDISLKQNQEISPNDINTNVNYINNLLNPYNFLIIN